MIHRLGGMFGAATLLWLVCGVAAPANAEVWRSRCGPLSHDVANLNAVNPRRAYWCKSDIAGYLGEERAGGVWPRHAHWRHWRHWRHRHHRHWR